MKICVIGLGEVGLQTAFHCEKVNLATIGYDISEEAVKRARDTGLTLATSDWNGVPDDVDVYLVCVNTNYRQADAGSIDVTAVFTACQKIKQRVILDEHGMTITPKLVCIESTIWIGTTRLVWENIFDKQVMVCHVPHRFWGKDPQERGVQRRRPLGAPDVNILTYAKLFYEETMEIPVDTASTVETVELVKVAENSWIYVWIAFAEELAMFCSKHDIDYNELRSLIATASDVPIDKRCEWQPQYNLAHAEQGIGGQCLPMAVGWLLSRSENMRILKAAKDTDDLYREWLKENG